MESLSPVAVALAELLTVRRGGVSVELCLAVASGVPETTFAALMPLVREKHLSALRLVEALSTSPARVARIEGGTLKVGERADMVARIEDVEPHRVDRARRPQAQRVHMRASPADDRRVEGDSLDGLVGMPHGARRAAMDMDRLDGAAEVNIEAGLRTLEFPRIAERQPGFGIFLLLAVLDDLSEQPVIIANAVAPGGDRKGRHGIHEAGGEAAEAAIAQRCVRLGKAQALQIDAEVPERRPVDVRHAQIVQNVAQHAADQEFQREVIDALAVLDTGPAVRLDPIMDDPVANGERRGDEPVAVGGVGRIAADRQRELADDCAARRLDILVAERRVVGDNPIVGRCRVQVVDALFHRARIGLDRSIRSRC